MSTLTFLLASIYSFILPLKNTTIEKHSFRSNLEQDRNNYSKINYSTIDLNVKLPQSLGKQVATVIDTTGEIVIGAKESRAQNKSILSCGHITSELISKLPTLLSPIFSNEGDGNIRVKGARDSYSYYLISSPLYLYPTPEEVDEKYKILHGIPAQFEKFEDVY